MHGDIDRVIDRQAVGQVVFDDADACVLQHAGTATLEHRHANQSLPVLGGDQGDPPRFAHGNLGPLADGDAEGVGIGAMDRLDAEMVGGDIGHGDALQGGSGNGEGLIAVGARLQRLVGNGLAGGTLDAFHFGREDPRPDGDALHGIDVAADLFSAEHPFDCPVHGGHGGRPAHQQHVGDVIGGEVLPAEGFVDQHFAAVHVGLDAFLELVAGEAHLDVDLFAFEAGRLGNDDRDGVRPGEGLLGLLRFVFGDDPESQVLG